MEMILNNKAWIVYPEVNNGKLQMTVTFSDSSKYNSIIKKLVTSYNGKLQKCNIGKDTRMVTIQNIYVLQLLSDVYTKDKKTSQQYSIYEDYIHIYNNQEKYFKQEYMI